VFSAQRLANDGNYLFSQGTEASACSMGTGYVSGSHIGVTSVDTLATAYMLTSTGFTYQGAQYRKFAPQKVGVWGDQWISPISGGTARGCNNLMLSTVELGTEGTGQHHSTFTAAKQHQAVHISGAPSSGMASTSGIHSLEPRRKKSKLACSLTRVF